MGRGDMLQSTAKANEAAYWKRWYYELKSRLEARIRALEGEIASLRGYTYWYEYGGYAVCGQCHATLGELDDFDALDPDVHYCYQCGTKLDGRLGE